MHIKLMLVSKPMEQDPKDKPDDISWPKPEEPLDPTQWFKPDPVDTTSSKKLPGMHLFSGKKAGIIILTIVGSIILLGGSTFAFVALKNRDTAPSGQSTIQSEPSPRDELARATEDTQGTGQDQPTGEPTPSDQTISQDQTDSVAPSTTDTPPTQQTQEPAPSAPGPTAPTHNTYSMSYTNSCFSPNTITIANGDTITFVNNSTRDMWPASDNHPSHTIYPEFDPGQSIAPGGSYSFTFSKSGTWGFHDHNKPNCDGTVTVQ